MSTTNHTTSANSADATTSGPTGRTNCAPSSTTRRVRQAESHAERVDRHPIEPAAAAGPRRRLLLRIHQPIQSPPNGKTTKTTKTTVIARDPHLGWGVQDSLASASLALGAAISPMILTLVVLIRPHPPPRLRLGLHAGATATLIAISLLGAQVFHTCTNTGPIPPVPRSRAGRAAAAGARVAGVEVQTDRRRGSHEAAQQRLDGRLPRHRCGRDAGELRRWCSSSRRCTRSWRTPSESLKGRDLPHGAVDRHGAGLAARGPGHRTGATRDPMLGRLNVAVSRHSNQINMIICLVFAVYLGYGAVQDLMG